MILGDTWETVVGVIVVLVILGAIFGDHGKTVHVYHHKGCLILLVATVIVAVIGGIAVSRLFHG
jgi:metal-dependent HD superfamily phosphatase/phosphodiesterase